MEEGMSMHIIGVRSVDELAKMYPYYPTGPGCPRIDCVNYINRIGNFFGWEFIPGDLDKSLRRVTRK